jgi:hypothetical protein
MDATEADIIMGSESWLRPEIKSSEIFPPGFKVFRKDRTSGAGGGVGVFLLVSEKYNSSEPE